MTRQTRVRYFATAVYFAAHVTCKILLHIYRVNHKAPEERGRVSILFWRRHKANVFVRSAIRKIYKGKTCCLNRGSRNTRSFAIYNLQKLHKSPCDIGYAICCPPFFVLFSVTASFIVRIVSRGDAIMQSVVEELTNFVIVASPSACDTPVKVHLEAGNKKKLRVSSEHVAIMQ